MALNNYLEDDWGDNSLSGRSNAKKDVFYHYGTGGSGDLLKGVYRPVWNHTDVDALSVTNNVLQFVMNDGNDTYADGLHAPSVWNVGSVSFDYQFVINNKSNGIWTRFVNPKTTIGNTGNGLGGLKSDSNNVMTFKWNSGTRSKLIDTAGADDTNLHSVKWSRDSYGNFEQFEDGSSMGTATDTFLPGTGYFTLYTFDSSNGNSEVHVDNLVVK